MRTAQLQLKLAAAAAFWGAVILVFFTRSVSAWFAETVVVLWLILAWFKARKTS